MPPKPHTFDDGRARTYRKKAEVMAFRSDAPFTFHKSWGTQENREGAWVIVALDARGCPTGDLYGCDAQAFADTYMASPSEKPDHYVKTATVRAYQPGQAFSIQTRIQDGDGGQHVETDVATGAADAWIVQNRSAELYAVPHVAFMATYQLVPQAGRGFTRRTRDQHLFNNGQPKRILALDGGGLRGILTMGYLRKLEALLRERHNDDSLLLSDYFDLIAGTSTGAIIAGGLALGMDTAKLTGIYDKLSQKIFKDKRWLVGARAKYDTRQLEHALQEHFGDLTLGSPLLRTGLLVVTKRLDTSSVWPLCNNPYDPYFDPGDDADWIPNAQYSLREIIRASTAAPYFFDPEPITIGRAAGKDSVVGDFVDGGISPHNNPALQALQLVTLKGYGIGWPMRPDKLLVVSVGTGSGDVGKGQSSMALGHTINAMLSLMDDCSEQNELMLQWMSESPRARRIDGAVGSLEQEQLGGRPLLTYLRYNTSLRQEDLLADLGVRVSEHEAKGLPAMDDPRNATLLKRIGERAAEVQMQGEHLPTRFDLE